MLLSAVLFDVDGTIAESEELHRISFNESFKEYGLSWYWDEAIYKELTFIGGGKERIKYYIERACPEMLKHKNLTDYIQALHKVKSQIYKDNLLEIGTSFRPGIERLLNDLKRNDIRVALVSSTSKENLNNLFKIGLKYSPEEVFEVIGHGECTPNKKPSPEIYFWVLDKMKLPPDACLAIEDAPKGVNSAIAAGLKVIVTPSKYTSDEDFKKGNLIISDLGEPDNKFKLIRGETFNQSYVNVDLLKKIHNS